MDDEQLKKEKKKAYYEKNKARLLYISACKREELEFELAEEFMHVEVKKKHYPESYRFIKKKNKDGELVEVAELIVKWILNYKTGYYDRIGF